MNFHQSFKKCSILTPDIRKQPQTSLELIKKHIKVQLNMATRYGAMYIVHKSMVEFSGASRKFNFMQLFSQKIDGFRQKDSQGF